MARTHTVAGVATLEHVRRCATETGRVLRDWGLPADRVSAWETAVSELATNVVVHGYPDGREGPLDLELTWDGSLLSIAIRDEGVGFDPDDVPPPPDPDPDDPSTWPEGGMGLMLVRSAVDELRYETRGQEHVLTLFTSLSAAT